MLFFFPKQNEQNGYRSMLFHRTFLRGIVAIGKGTIAIGRRCHRLFRALQYFRNLRTNSDILRTVASVYVHRKMKGFGLGGMHPSVNTVLYLNRDTGSACFGLIKIALPNYLKHGKEVRQCELAIIGRPISNEREYLVS